MPAQICFDNECWPPNITALLPKVLPALCKINFEVLFKNMLEKDPANNAGEESSSDWGAQRKWQPLPCPSVSHGALLAYDKVAVACLVVFLGASSLTHRVES